MSDRFDLQRFVEAQDAGGTYDRALAELRAGRKRSHWMWFVFPQLADLGHSAMAQRYAIRSLDEARAYLAHPPLGDRLRESIRALLAAPAGLSARDILGDIDALKLRSSMTLFMRAAPDEPLFEQLLERFYSGGGQGDRQRFAPRNIRPEVPVGSCREREQPIAGAPASRPPAGGRDHRRGTADAGGCGGH